MGLSSGFLILLRMSKSDRMIEKETDISKHFLLKSSASSVRTTSSGTGGGCFD